MERDKIKNKKFFLLIITLVFTIFLLSLISAMPNVTIITPTNTTYNTSTIIFNVTAINETSMVNGSCWASIDAGVTNLTLLNTTHNDQYNATNTTVPDGGYLAQFWCNDSENNINNTETISFSVDTIYPEITIVNPSNNSNLSSVTFDLNYTYTEINPGFCWYSNNSGVVNSSYLSMGTNLTDATEITWAEGLWNVTVWCNDTANNVNSTMVRFTIDTTAPSVSCSCSPTTISFGGKITCTSSFSDTGGTGIASSTSPPQYPSTQSYGSHVVGCSATDYAGNSASSSVTYYVTSGGGGGSGGGYSGYDNTFVEDKEEFSEVKEITKSLGKKNRIRIKINNQEHYIGIKELTETSATIEVSSTSQSIVFNMGDENKFDVTEDGYYDLKVKLNSIESEKADITITSIHEEVPEEEGVIEKTIGTLQEGKSVVWIIIGVLIIIIVAGYFILRKKK